MTWSSRCSTSTAPSSAAKSGGDRIEHCLPIHAGMSDRYPPRYAHLDSIEVHRLTPQSCSTSVNTSRRSHADYSRPPFQERPRISTRSLLVTAPYPLKEECNNRPNKEVLDTIPTAGGGNLLLECGRLRRTTPLPRFAPGIMGTMGLGGPRQPALRNVLATGRNAFVCATVLGDWFLGRMW
jgi:hypothetical protein